ncbi:anti-adapter protein IraM [Salmonella enterica subsp. enterica serovar Chester]|jgi:hypothetical protein|nr:anti-adapter protein IraM [Salmonella enterica]ECC9297384.1 anti-adapter protein IraM [Salmonella enterica subsp. salamae]ECZ9752977.1 anti-adapter protein IraM [Salmonella enterica subsp. enterica serovar Weltevreden]EJQ0043136.1 anti-adapter protein IraM [Salmonella enterica subsp. enterica serovar Newport]EJV0836046.1 anti-adapter protein IraM [Salmonella enterica subsp. enterica serovar Chester]
MQWYVIDTVVSPSAGICFSSIRGLKNLKLTIWYQADIFMPPGSIIEPWNRCVIVNGKILPITVYNVTRYNKELWGTMKEKSTCPGNKRFKEKSCTNHDKCIISVCPFGLIKKKPETFNIEDPIQVRRTGSTDSHNY